MRKINITELKEYIEAQSDETKIYIGCDSFRKKRNGKWWAYFTTVVVVHINGRNGCRVFGEITKEMDFDKNKKRPVLRLMNEVYKSVEFLKKIEEAIGDRDVELHLDINPDERHGSSVAVQQAIGYVKGVTGLHPKVKPDGWAATHAADHFREYSSSNEFTTIEEKE